MENRPYKIVYLTPALYMAGGVERVLTLKANYFADRFGYDVTIVLTEGRGKPYFYPLSERVKVVNLDIRFEELWTCSFARKVIVYLQKQRQFRRQLSRVLMQLRPDITVSLLRREINFLCDIEDGSRKIGELHVNRANYRNFEATETNLLKRLFAKLWMRSLVGKLRRLDRFVVLTREDRQAWPELSNVTVMPDPLSFVPTRRSQLAEKRVIAVGRYVYQKGFDLLLQAWARVGQDHPDWQLAIYGDGDRTPYEQLRAELGIDEARCQLNGPTTDIQSAYVQSSLFVFSSRFEGFGMVLVEAMACGLPVVSFDCPCGPKDIISHEQDGLLVPHGDVEALAAALNRVMGDERLRRSLAANALEKAKVYEIGPIAGQWKQLFNELG